MIRDERSETMRSIFVHPTSIAGKIGLNGHRYGIPVREINHAPLPMSVINRYVLNFKTFQRVSNLDFTFEDSIRCLFK